MLISIFIFMIRSSFDDVLMESNEWLCKHEFSFWWSLRATTTAHGQSEHIRETNA